MKADPLQLHPLSRTATLFPEHPALQIGNLSVSYSELYAQAKGILKNWSARGIHSGQIVALGDLLPQEMITTIWACTLGNLLAFPLNIRFPHEAISNILSEHNPILIISNTSYPGHDSITYSDLLLESIQSEHDEDPPFDELQPATLLMTSGSSGAVKFVEHCHRNHIQSALGSNQNIPLDSAGKWLLSLPLYHIGGLSILYKTVLTAATIVIPENSRVTLDEIDESGSTHISLVSTQLQRFMRENNGPKTLKKLQAILLGGSAFPQTLIQKALDHALPIHLSYGSTEMASQITTTSGGQQKAALTAVGRVLPGRDLIISHEGEILVKGDTLARGYLKASRLTDFRDAEGWFHTGDVGYINVKGELTVTGRMDNQFISGGENIQPEYIESFLCNIEGILDATVVPRYDKEFGARPVAFLELEGTGTSGEEITQQLKNQLPGYMLPVVYYDRSGAISGDNLKISRQRLSNLLLSKNNHLHSL